MIGVVLSLERFREDAGILGGLGACSQPVDFGSLALDISRNRGCGLTL